MVSPSPDVQAALTTATQDFAYRAAPSRTRCNRQRRSEAGTITAFINTLNSIGGIP